MVALWELGADVSVGPILIFDKSTLESLSVDEAVWLDAHYLVNITPLFFVETLADLEKEIRKRRSPEQVVGNLAEKTPSGGHPNVHHVSICVGELLGHPVEMRGVPVVGGGECVVLGDRRGMVFKQPPEIVALQRWEEGRFLEVERDYARAWRRALSGVDLAALYRKGKAIIERQGRPRDLAESKAMAVAMLNRDGRRYVGLKEALDTLRMPEELRRVVVARWKAEGGPPLQKFAPYTAHVLTVDLFFCLGLGADLISRERPSNKIDIAYLYYLPFCMVFTSSDNLHARTVPLFLTGDQVFIRGPELKADLAKLDAHYSALPDGVKARGVVSFASYPPTEGDFLVSRLWDKHMAPEWKRNARRERKPPEPEAERKLVRDIARMADAPRVLDRAPLDLDEADYVVFERRVPLFKGKWRLLPPEVQKDASSSNQPLPTDDGTAGY